MMRTVGQYFKKNMLLIIITLVALSVISQILTYLNCAQADNMRLDFYTQGDVFRTISLKIHLPKVLPKNN